MTWTLWAAAGLLVVGGLAPFVFGGTSSRIDGVIFPFGIAAVILAACSLVPNLSRSAIAVLYFVAGMAVVYGLLSMFSLPVRLAVLGTCPAPPAICTTGLPKPLTDGENTGMGVAAALGILALLLGFYGLVTIYRKTAIAPFTPPVRTMPPVAAPPPTPAAETPPPADETPPPEPVAVTARDEQKEEPELPPHEEEELPELPPHESSTSTT
jgi:hypothetical protein